MSNNGICSDPTRRHDFVILFEVTDGNPNGDPDAGNLPRVDPETMQGLVTDVCIKRKMRDYFELADGASQRNKIYVQNKGVALNTQHQKAYTALDQKSTGTKQQRDQVADARAWMCKNFIDIRLFGAVMTTGVNCGQVRGPFQITFARSIDPVIPLDLSITRVAVTKPEDPVTASDEGQTAGKQTEMGRKALLPYGLYRGAGFFSPRFAEDTGVTAADMQLAWDALVGMWDLDHSASRGMMSCRGLYVFTHENPLGNAPAHALFDSITVQRDAGVEAPRRFADYTVTVPLAAPPGVTLTRIVG